MIKIHKISRLFTLFFSLFLISGCYPVDTTHIFSPNSQWTIANSNPIYLTFQRDSNLLYYFILNKVSNKPHYELIVRWRSPSQKIILYDSENSQIKFIIENEEILTFTPIKKPRIVAYNLDSNGHEEEAIFHLTYDQIYQLAYAKNVEVALFGRDRVITAKFNGRNTTRAFRDFIKNSN